MTSLFDLLNPLTNLNQNLNILVQTYGPWVYLILFVIIFLETGLVVTPFLPGDSLLFLTGLLASTGSFSLPLLIILLSAAAILGDSVNYSVGRFVGPRIFKLWGGRFLKKEHLELTGRFYEKYGRETIVVARYVPVIRTFAPFLAGVGGMNYRRFIVYNILGGISWVAVFVSAGYFFGNIPIVKENIDVLVSLVILVSIPPGFIVITVLSKTFKRLLREPGRKVEAE